jgi:predicted acylesterase/phospholipase RssA
VKERRRQPLSWLRTRRRDAAPALFSQPRARRVVFAFSGGGINGAAQAGMVRELLAAGILPDALVGVSAGALNATYVAATPLDQAGHGLVNIWHQVAINGIFDANSPKRLWAIVRQRSSLDPGTKLSRIIYDHCPVAQLEDCALPVTVGTVRSDTAEMVWHSQGEAAPRLRASAAIPGVFPPIMIDGQLHIDGATFSPVPVVAALDHQPDLLVILDVTMMYDLPDTAARSSVAPTSALGMLLSGYEAARRRAYQAEMQAVPDSVEKLVIQAGIHGGMLPEAAQRIPEIIELGAQAARSAIEAHASKVASPAR